MRQVRLVFLLMVLFIWTVLAGTGIAGDWIKPGEERFKITGGVFLAALDSTLQIDSKELGEGTEIDVEDDLDFDDTATTYHLDGYWRFAERHRLFAGIFRFDRDASAVLNKELVIDGETFPVGAGVKSDFNLDIMPVSYGYSFINNEKHELTGTLGFHWQKAEFSTNRHVYAGSEQEALHASADVSAPLPMLGFFYEYRFSERWTAGAVAEVFYLKASSDTFSFSGSLLSLGGKTEYWLFNNVGIGAALNYFRLNVDVEDSEWRGELDFQYCGPRIYVSVRF